MSVPDQSRRPAGTPARFGSTGGRAGRVLPQLSWPVRAACLGAAGASAWVIKVAVVVLAGAQGS